MDCSRTRELLSAVSDGELRELPTAAQAHLHDCAECKDVQENYRELAEDLTELYSAGFKPGDIKIPAPKKPASAAPFGPWFSTIATATAVVCISFGIGMLFRSKSPVREHQASAKADQKSSTKEDQVSPNKPDSDSRRAQKTWDQTMDLTPIQITTGPVQVPAERPLLFDLGGNRFWAQTGSNLTALEKNVLQVNKGGIFITTLEKENEFKIKTVDGTVSARDGRFSVYLEKVSTRVAVQEGSCRMTCTGGELVVAANTVGEMYRTQRSEALGPEIRKDLKPTEENLWLPWPTLTKDEKEARLAYIEKVLKDGDTEQRTAATYAFGSIDEPKAKIIDQWAERDPALVSGWATGYVTSIEANDLELDLSRKALRILIADPGIPEDLRGRAARAFARVARVEDKAFLDELLLKEKSARVLEGLKLARMAIKE